MNIKYNDYGKRNRPDPKFVHYGIRKDDLATIEAICEAESIDFNWLSEEILKAYHAKGDFYTNAQYPLIMKQHTIDKGY